MGDLGFIHRLGRSPGEGKGYSLQYSGLENSLNCIVRGVTKSWTRLDDFHCHFTKAEVDVFLELFRFFYDPTDVGNLIFDSSEVK